LGRLAERPRRRTSFPTARVYLEAVELRAADLELGADSRVESWVVAHLTSPVTAARVSVVPGTETRRAMTCALAAPRK
jgi:hypothetical protein